MTHRHFTSHMMIRKLIVFAAWLGAGAILAFGARPALSANPGAPAAHAGEQAGSSHCPALPAPSGRIVEVDSEEELWNAVNEGVPNTTILIADGTYNLAAQGYYLWIDTPNITLRSASGDRDGVILDDNYQGSEIISVAASHVTIADLTVKRAGTHPIHVVSTDSADTLDTLIYNVHIIDPGQQGIKINPNANRDHFPDQGEIACSEIELTDAGRPVVWEINGSCYTGGVDAHYAWGWTIRDNLIHGFWCDQGLSEHAIHLWTGSRDTLIERNVLVDNARGVGLGLLESGTGRTYPDDPCPEASGYVDHYGGIVRNNFISASRPELFNSSSGFDCGICLAQACNARLVHNTVASTQAPFSSIEWRFPNSRVEITDNLVSHNLRERDGASGVLAGNLESAPLSLFVDAGAGDLHLNVGADAAIDQGAPVPAGLCDEDIDGDPRPIGAARDIGADEAGVPSLAAIHDLEILTAVASGDTLTATLGWTPPEGAAWIEIRVHDSPLDESNWEAGQVVAGDIPGDASSYTAAVSYTGGSVFFALRWQDTSGAWSPPSNNVFWPQRVLFLPLVVK